MRRASRLIPPGAVRRAVAAGERAARRMDELFGAVDVLLTPALACRPPRIGQLDDGGMLRQLYAATPMVAFTAIWNVTGHPAASVPAGIGEDGLPLSVQLVGPRDGEPRLLSLSAQLERERPWPMPAGLPEGRAKTTTLEV